MINLSLAEIAALTDGQIHGPERRIEGLSTDSRTLSPGALFVALKGPRHDGHDAVAEAAARGAAAVVVSRPVDAVLPSVQVTDTRTALGAIARGWRLRHAVPVIGITGSNGKTTTKEMLASILGQRGAVLATEGNLNNHIGVPLTLCRLGKEHRAAVIEMGANAMDDIAELAAIVQPTIGIVTLCGPAHLEGFGSIENVALAKGRLFEALPADGVAVVNADDRFATQWRSATTAQRVVSFGLRPDADFTARDIVLGAPGEGVRFRLVCPAGQANIVLPLEGEHNVRNALAAAAAACAAGADLADVAQGLTRMTPVKGRLVLKRGRAGSRIIDDSYNANPASLAAALAVLGRAPDPRWLVLGDMGELGAAERAAHEAAGDLARDAGVSRLFTLGPRARLAAPRFGAGAASFDDPEALCVCLEAALTTGVTVLVKGSRMMALDKVVSRIVETGQPSC